MMTRTLTLARQAVKNLSLLILLAALAGACSINPVSKLPEVTLITVEQEKKIGEEEAKKVEQEMGLLDDATLMGYVDAVANGLSRNRRDMTCPRNSMSWTWSSRTPLRFPAAMCTSRAGCWCWSIRKTSWLGWSATKLGTSLRGRRSRGFPAKGRSALITNLVSGVTGFFVPVVGNIVGGVGNFAQSLGFSPYSRSQESEADEVGQEMAAKAGWDPVGLATFLATLGVRKRCAAMAQQAQLFPLLLPRRIESKI